MLTAVAVCYEDASALENSLAAGDEITLTGAGTCNDDNKLRSREIFINIYCNPNRPFLKDVVSKIALKCQNTPINHDKSINSRINNARGSPKQAIDTI